MNLCCQIVFVKICLWIVCELSGDQQLLEDGMTPEEKQYNDPWKIVWHSSVFTMAVNQALLFYHSEAQSSPNFYSPKEDPIQSSHELGITLNIS